MTAPHEATLKTTDARASLGRVSLGIEQAARAAIEAALRAGEQNAFATTLFRDRTRRLRSSTRGTPIAGSRVLRAKLRNATPYAKFIEYGTSRMRARPFMRQAGAVASTVLTRGIYTAVGEVVRRG